jgi:CarD family transcriptional regulator
VAIYAKKERNFMFSIGDKVVYPMHGAGIIESIEEREILGELKKYYVMKMPIGEMKVMIPINNVEGIGIRDVIDNKCADSVFKSLEIKSDEQTSNWNKRYRENMDKIKSGDVFEVADVVKHLVLRERNKGLSTGERKMLNSAKQILISELVLAKNMNPNDVEDIINTRITS